MRVDVSSFVFLPILNLWAPRGGGRLLSDSHIAEGGDDPYQATLVAARSQTRTKEIAVGIAGRSYSSQLLEGFFHINKKQQKMYPTSSCQILWEELL